MQGRNPIPRYVLIHHKREIVDTRSYEQSPLTIARALTAIAGR
jgi:hypothetical protein